MEAVLVESFVVTQEEEAMANEDGFLYRVKMYFFTVVIFLLNQRNVIDIIIVWKGPSFEVGKCRHHAFHSLKLRVYNNYEVDWKFPYRIYMLCIYQIMNVTLMILG